jgi:hypothetical protein
VILTLLFLLLTLLSQLHVLELQTLFVDCLILFPLVLCQLELFNLRLSVVFQFGNAFLGSFFVLEFGLVGLGELSVVFCLERRVIGRDSIKLRLKLGKIRAKGSLELGGFRHLLVQLNLHVFKFTVFFEQLIFLLFDLSVELSDQALVLL